MITFIFAFCLLATIIIAMSVGVIFQNKPIKGSCGGMAALGMVSDCEICGGDRNICEDVNENKGTQLLLEDKSAARFYDVSQSSSSNHQN